MKAISHHLRVLRPENPRQLNKEMIALCGTEALNQRGKIPRMCIASRTCDPLCVALCCCPVIIFVRLNIGAWEALNQPAKKHFLYVRFLANINRTGDRSLAVCLELKEGFCVQSETHVEYLNSWKKEQLLLGCPLDCCNRVNCWYHSQYYPIKTLHSSK